MVYTTSITHSLPHKRQAMVIAVALFVLAQKQFFQEVTYEHQEV